MVAGSESYTDAGRSPGCPGLRLIARCGVGFDAIDIDAATARSIAVSITPDANSDGVADLALTLMLACLRRTFLSDRCARTGAWRPPGLSGDLTGATVGIVGLGRVGRNVVAPGERIRLPAARGRARPDREFCQEYAVEIVELDDASPRGRRAHAARSAHPVDPQA